LFLHKGEIISVQKRYNLLVKNSTIHTFTDNYAGIEHIGNLMR
jgi:hypothetical protein